MCTYVCCIFSSLAKKTKQLCMFAFLTTPDYCTGRKRFLSESDELVSGNIMA